MKVIIMEESRKRNSQIAELLERRKHQVVSCAGSGEFMEALYKGSADRILMNVEAWQRGNAMYKYFDIIRRMGATPVVFYNAPENFVNIPSREQNQGDRVLTKPVETEAVVEALE
ncbi:MAG: hypothetical protein GF418_12230 [Chitinivibrionales bacterium]|nr:hypothetical protein [Chitinivibrionales bacterium]MBD3396386.1 hypothetical protein [Chitinivibrionales bacterium]